MQICNVFGLHDLRNVVYAFQLESKLYIDLLDLKRVIANLSISQGIVREVSLNSLFPNKMQARSCDILRIPAAFDMHSDYENYYNSHEVFLLIILTFFSCPVVVINFLIWMFRSCSPTLPFHLFCLCGETNCHDAGCKTKYLFFLLEENRRISLSNLTTHLNTYLGSRWHLFFPTPERLSHKLFLFWKVLFLILFSTRNPFSSLTIFWRSNLLVSLFVRNMHTSEKDKNVAKCRYKLRYENIKCLIWCFLTRTACVTHFTKAFNILVYCQSRGVHPVPHLHLRLTNHTRITN